MIKEIIPSDIRIFFMELWWNLKSGVLWFYAQWLMWRQFSACKRAQDEFDPCLNTDTRILLQLSTESSYRYRARIIAERERLHYQNLGEEYPFVFEQRTQAWEDLEERAEGKTWDQLVEQDEAEREERIQKILSRPTA